MAEAEEESMQANTNTHAHTLAQRIPKLNTKLRQHFKHRLVVLETFVAFWFPHFYLCFHMNVFRYYIVVSLSPQRLKGKICFSITNRLLGIICFFFVVFGFFVSCRNRYICFSLLFHLSEIIKTAKKQSYSCWLEISFLFLEFCRTFPVFRVDGKPLVHFRIWNIVGHVPIPAQEVWSHTFRSISIF